MFEYNPNMHRVRLLSIEEVIFIIVYEKSSLKFTLTYAFYVNGPFLVGLGKVDQIKISNQNYPVMINVNPDHSQERFKYLESKKLNSSFSNQTTKKYHFKLNQFYTFYGNLRDIVLNSQNNLTTNMKEQIEIQKPLTVIVGEDKSLLQDEEDDENGHYETDTENNLKMYLQKEVLTYGNKDNTSFTYYDIKQNRRRVYEFDTWSYQCQSFVVSQ